MVKPPDRHTIENISFSKDAMICSCGWSGRPDDFQQHRSAVGANKPNRKIGVEHYTGATPSKPQGDTDE